MGREEARMNSGVVSEFEILKGTHGFQHNEINM